MFYIISSAVSFSLILCSGLIGKLIYDWYLKGLIHVDISIFHILGFLFLMSLTENEKLETEGLDKNEMKEWTFNKIKQKIVNLLSILLISWIFHFFV